MSEHVHKLRIIQVQNITEKGVLKITFKYLDLPLNTPDFSEFLKIPNRETMSEKEFKRAVWELKDFFTAFGIPMYGATNPTEDWIGLEGEVKFQN